MLRETTFLKLVVGALGLLVLCLIVYTMTFLFSGEAGGYSPMLIGMYVSAIPFYVALYQTLRLLGFIDKDEAFSDHSVDALGLITYCAVIITALYAIGMPYIYYVAEIDDAPGVILVGMVITGASGVIAVFAATLQKLLRSAIAIKSENDLTV